MTVDWQNVAALAIVATAVVYLLLGLFRTSNTVTPSCGSSCGGCGNAEEPKLVTLTIKT